MTVLAHRLSEIDTPAFREFLEEAAASFQPTLKRMQTKPEDVMPWKVNGERWHLGEKGFPPGKKLAVGPGAAARACWSWCARSSRALEVRWDVRDAITLRVPGVSAGWAQWRTKETDGLDCRFLGKKGQFNLSRLEGVGAARPRRFEARGSDVIELVFQHLEPSQAAKLKELLAEHLRGFREAFGKGDASRGLGVSGGQPAGQWLSFTEHYCSKLPESGFQTLLHLFLLDFRIFFLDVLHGGKVVPALSVLTRLQRFDQDRFDRRNDLRAKVGLGLAAQFTRFRNREKPEPGKAIPPGRQPIGRMLVKAPPQWPLRRAPYVDHLSSIIEKVDPDLFVEIDGFGADLLHSKNLRVDTHSIASRLQNIPKDEMISYWTSSSSASCTAVLGGWVMPAFAFQTNRPFAILWNGHLSPSFLMAVDNAAETVAAGVAPGFERSPSSMILLVIAS